jgi:DNA-binding NarL/FixJ family response regulator
VTTLVIAEDSFLVREGMVRMLASSPGLDVLAACEDFDGVIRAIDAAKPDVVLTDIRMPPTRTDEGLRVAAHCRREHPATGVLLLSQYADAGYVKGLLANGTEGRGYLLKERVGDLTDLLDAIDAVARGGSAIDPKVVESLVQRRARTGGADLAALSPREREVLAAVAQGRTNAAVAAALHLTQKAVEKHINSIFAKLGLTGDQHNHPRVRATLMYLSDQRS